MPDPITFTLDGEQITAQPGQTIIQAAMAAGKYIPYLCYFPKMKPYGACRMCMVETEVTGPRGVAKATVASCTAPVQKDMVVRSTTDAVKDIRKGIMELLMAEHPHGCLTCHRIELCGPQDICQRHVGVTDRCTICPKNERCELKDTVRSVELDLRTPLNYHRRNLPIHTDDPFYDRDYNLCIVCARCVRVCDEVRVDVALTLTNRSGVALVGTVHCTSLPESSCEFCGACVDVCPVGALVEREYKWEKATRKVKTICTACPVGCQLVIEVNKFGKVIRSVGDIQGPANNGQTCFRGKFTNDYPNAKERLKYPYLRDAGVLKRVTWDDAAGRIAAAFKRYKPAEIAIIASPRSTNEDSFVAGRFAREVLSTPNVTAGMDVVPELLDRMKARLGYGAATGPVWATEKSKCILVVSGNPTEEQNVLAVPVKKAFRSGAQLIVIDTRETELTRHAREWLRPRPGTETLLLSAMARVVLDETLEDKEFVGARTVDVEEIKKSLAQVDPGAAARECGIDEAQVRRAARAFAKSGASSLLFGVDTFPASGRTEYADAAINLAMLAGAVGKDGAGIYPLFPGANTVGSRDVGCVPGTGGVGARDLAAAIRTGRIKAAFLIADGLNAESDQLDGLAGALGRLEFLAVSSVFDTEATRHAAVVLPLTPYSEQHGTYTNIERRVQMVRRINSPKNEERTGWESLAAIARAMGSQSFAYSSSDEVFDDIRKAVPEYAGLTYGRLEHGGIQAPCRDEQSLGSTHTGTGDLKLSFVPVRPSPDGRAAGHLLLAHGRVLFQEGRDAGIVKRGNMNYIGREEIISVHPQDLVSLGFAAGDSVTLHSATGEEITGRLDTASPLPGVVTVTTLFGQVVSGVQDDPRPDPAPYVPGLRLSEVKLTRAEIREPAAAASR